MQVLVIGQGGREHAIAWKLAQSPKVTQVFCAPGNAGTEVDARNVDINATDTERLIRFAKETGINLTVVGPEAPLVEGVVDAFRSAGLRIFGPTRSAARLEGSKTFAKTMMRRANVPTADFSSFTDVDDALRYLDEREETPLVVKADGLAAGKGVVVCRNREEAVKAVREMMVERQFGAAGDRIMIEERLNGQELSVLAIVDGRTIVTLEPSQDHKAAHDGDRGPNTGGMGAYSPTPIATPEVMDEVIHRILIPLVHTMRKEGAEYTGVLYAGLMLTSQGIKVLEFNVRLGDPEAQPVLMRLKSDLFDLMWAATSGGLHEFAELEWDERPAVCVVMASEGYPGDYEKGRVIRGLPEAAALSETKVFHAGTSRQGDQVVTSGGRVLGVTALGRDISDAKRKAYTGVKCIRWEGAWCRKDISDKARLA
ncbi:MAG: phosphoribosylamine--glycine ligase [Planctomycetota bacterium]|nr:MAG: phosphoribosylamine--glycine ligase [Planctomycetota bacterium]REK28872.1 MAG: phosphoribosylamine--glycine ligase [Planctomycetota bacterium]REK39694.1 MAG: phosphoribosylamine--glycine ligase [Planctomycetota bacterium]